MTINRSGNVLRAAVAALVVLASAGFALSRINTRSGVRVVQNYRPDDSIPRLRFLGDPVPGAMNIRDFDVSGEELYLLDAAAPRVIVMHESDGHWSVARTFGRHGGGPGEMLQPSGIAVRGDSVLIADRELIHYFTSSGRYLTTRAPLFPCGLMDPHVYASASGVYLAGRCMRADTSTAELFFIGTDGTVRPVAHDPLFTSDGRIGSMFAASSFFTPGSQYGLFGGGTSDCIFRITERDTLPLARQQCGLGAQRYPFVASAEFKAKAKALAAARPFASAVLAVPDLLPVYSERLPGRNGDFVFRPFSNDSFAFRLAASDHDILIAEVDGLVGCRDGGCLWMREEDAPQMMFVPASALDGAASSRHR